MGISYFSLTKPAYDERSFDAYYGQFKKWLIEKGFVTDGRFSGPYYDMCVIHDCFLIAIRDDAVACMFRMTCPFPIKIVERKTGS